MRKELLSLSRSSFEYVKSIHPQLAQICKPLKSHFGIDYFYYNKFIPGSLYLSIGTDLNLHEYFLSSDIDRHVHLQDTSHFSKKRTEASLEFNL